MIINDTAVERVKLQFLVTAVTTTMFPAHIFSSNNRLCHINCPSHIIRTSADSVVVFSLYSLRVVEFVVAIISLSNIYCKLSYIIL